MTQERSTVFQQLKTFLTQQMRMSHLYQPLMLRTLIDQGDFASGRVLTSSRGRSSRRRLSAPNPPSLPSAGRQWMPTPLKRADRGRLTPFSAPSPWPLA